MDSCGEMDQCYQGEREIKRMDYYKKDQKKRDGLLLEREMNGLLLERNDYRENSNRFIERWITDCRY